MKNLKMSISLPISVFKEGKSYVAFTPVLDLSTSASTYEKAKERFNEAVTIFLEETIKQGTLEENLKNLGWKRVQKKWTPPVTISQNIESFKFPSLA